VAALGAFAGEQPDEGAQGHGKPAWALLKGSKYTKARYMELLALLYDILQKARKEGLMSIEKDVEDAARLPLFKKYPTVGHDHHVVEFITDYLRMMVSGNLNAHEIESLMDSEIETHHQEEHAPSPPCPPGRRPAGLRHRGRRAGRGEHHGLGGPAAGGAGRHDRLGAGRHLPGHSAGLRRGRTAGRPAGAEGRRQRQGIAVHQDHAAGQHAGLRPQVAIEFGRKVLFSGERPSFTELEGHVAHCGQEVPLRRAARLAAAPASRRAVQAGRTP
jgi:chemotaxis protein MotA